MSNPENVLDQNITINELTVQWDATLDNISTVLLGESQPYDISFTNQGNEIHGDITFTFDRDTLSATD